MKEEKKSWGMDLLEAVFGQFRSPEPSRTRRRCIRCRRKYDVRNMRTKKDDPRFDVQQFCSATCADKSPASSDQMSRQGYRASLRKEAKEQVAREMGVGPAAINPRRQRRKVALNRAHVAYRKAKGLAD